VNQNDCSVTGTKKLWRSGHRRMRGEGADGAGRFSSKPQSDCENVRPFRDRGNSEPRRHDVSYQPFLGLTER
jgi:hypothetical protein